MKIKIINNILYLFSSITYSFTEPYVHETNTYEKALVVETTITNKLKKQEIRLTKTSRFEDIETKIEADADVYITYNTGIRYDFEKEAGKYISSIEFQATTEKEYRLKIKTKDGRSFTSTTEKLSIINPMQNVQSEVETKDGIRGVSIKISSYTPTNTAKYYRYEYKETYKVITPKWGPNTISYVDGNWSINQNNSPNKKTCYGRLLHLVEIAPLCIKHKTTIFG